MRPRLPLPEALRGNELGTFAHDSVERRLPEIAHRTIAENDLSPDRAARVTTLAKEISDNDPISTIDEPLASDAPMWASHATPHLGNTWLDVPWFFAETYFYRRLLAATGFSQPGERAGIDPFAAQKAAGLDDAMDLAARLGEELAEPGVLVAAALWANRVDLSLWPAGETDSEERTRAVLGEAVAQLLVDDGEQAIASLAGATVCIVLDNAGAELVADLALAAHVVETGGRVVLHAKAHPTFVSDATPDDIATTVSRLSREPSPAREIARVLEGSKALGIAAHPFWVSPLPFWERPRDLDDDLGAVDLVIVKGDANYRRLLGDLRWDATTPIVDIVLPPAPLVALRTSKAEVMAGLEPETIARAAIADPDWLVNGQWGMIQYVPAAR
ncbi:MAG: damage-control phosphatase ARMT1 family protein [Acidimicrobiia bacterium]|nr:damage-control phosphatase ARMT1 family protein [Acidimicrobiia bacterium]